MKINFAAAIQRVLKASDGPGCLPFLGAGFSAWTDVDRPSKWSSVLRRAAGPVADGGHAVQATAVAVWPDKTNFSVQNMPGAAPSWFLQGCMFHCLSKKDIRQIRHGLPQTGLSTIAQWLYDKNPTLLAGLLSDLYERCIPGVRHRKLSYFPLDVIATTNYDKCLEIAFEEVGEPLHAVSDDMQLKGDGLRWPVVLKLHGSLDKPMPRNAGNQAAQRYLSQIVLTDSQYWGFPRGRRLMVDYLRTLVVSRQMIFLGYGLQDFNIIEQLHRLARHVGQTPHPILLLPRATEYEVQLLNERKIDVTLGDLDEFLRQMTSEYFGGVEDLDALCPQDDRKGSNARIAAAAGILLRRAERCPAFKETLRNVISEHRFPRRLLAQHNVWPQGDTDRLGAFEKMGWLRRIEIPGESQDVFCEFPVEIRLAVNERLKR